METYLINTYAKALYKKKLRDSSLLISLSQLLCALPRIAFH